MQFIKYILFFLTVSVFAQESISTDLIIKQPLKVDKLIGIDNFETQFYVKDNTFYKNSRNKTLNYSKVQFGDITSANAFNPLKINLFYNDFNTAVVLDNRLAEIALIDFNTIKPFRNVTHISTANDNAIWLFNQNTQQLELFDYKINKTRLKTLPVSSDVLDLKSNYNYCWILTESYIYMFNYVGSLISKIEHSGFEHLEESNGNIFLLKSNQLFFKSKDSEEIKPIDLSELLINQFLVTNETLYIYSDGILHQYRLKTD